eukprot:Lithocolla_globosa_v1_NODE_652_length_3504_cov_114.978834.p1 type:complete len:418 gc:universal NODE_652_length_3504_cov_114.978834:1432-2685(+)
MTGHALASPFENVVTLHSYSIDPFVGPSLVMENCLGTLMDLLKSMFNTECLPTMIWEFRGEVPREKEMALAVILSEVAEQIGTALMDINSLSIYHRDVSGTNVFFSVDGVFKLGDFGQCKQLGLDTNEITMSIAPSIHTGTTRYNPVSLPTYIDASYDVVQLSGVLVEGVTIRMIICSDLDHMMTKVIRTSRDFYGNQDMEEGLRFIWKLAQKNWQFPSHVFPGEFVRSLGLMLNSWRNLKYLSAREIIQVWFLDERSRCKDTTPRSRMAGLMQELAELKAQESTTIPLESPQSRVRGGLPPRPPVTPRLPVTPKRPPVGQQMELQTRRLRANSSPSESRFSATTLPNAKEETALREFVKTVEKRTKIKRSIWIAAYKKSAKTNSLGSQRLNKALAHYWPRTCKLTHGEFEDFIEFY